MQRISGTLPSFPPERSVHVAEACRACHGQHVHTRTAARGTRLGVGEARGRNRVYAEGITF